MTLRSAIVRRATPFTAVLLAALAVGLPVLAASATFSGITTGTSTASPALATAPSVATTPTLTVSLLASAPTVSVGGTFGYTADIRLGQPTSYLQAVLEVSRPSGVLLFKRTHVASHLPAGEVRFSFERALTDVLALEPGSYPVRLSVAANAGGSTITTETNGVLRVFDSGGPSMSVALVARVSGDPMMAPDGRFAVDPAIDTRARDSVEAICLRILTDPTARVTLAMPPLMLTEWRRLSGGYTMVDGRVVRPTDPVAVAYNSTLADLKAAIDSQRLELMSLGYADPNLTDLANHGLATDIGPQYDAGISAVFASLEVTPSVGTAPSAGCMPPNEVDLLSQKGIRYIVLDTDCLRVVKDSRGSPPPPGVYPVSHARLTAIAIDETQTALLTGGNPNPAIGRAFARLMVSPKQPLVFECDVTNDAPLAAGSIGLALSAFETQPWVQLVPTRGLKPADSADHVQPVAGKSTPHSPKDYWKTVSISRNYAGAYYAALGSSAPDAVTAESQSLIAESSAWAGDDARWTDAARGLDFATSSLKVTQPVLDSVKVKLEKFTLSGASGTVPVTITNGSEKTLNVVVNVRTSGGMRVVGPNATPTTLRPQDTLVEVPVAMPAALSGKLTVEVLSGNLVLARKSATVRTSALDRIALGGMVVLILLGMLAFIVRRERAAQAASAEAKGAARYTDFGDDDDASRSDA